MAYEVNEMLRDARIEHEALEARLVVLEAEREQLRAREQRWQSLVCFLRSHVPLTCDMEVADRDARILSEEARALLAGVAPRDPLSKEEMAQVALCAHIGNREERGLVASIQKLRAALGLAQQEQE